MQDSTQALALKQEESTASKVLKANDFAALDNARQGIEQARAEAASIIAAAHQEAETIRAAARAEAETDRAALVAEYAARMNDQVARTQETLTGVVMTSLRRILDPVPKAEKVAGAVACALRETDIAGGAVLIVAPALMHTLREKFEQRGIPPEMLEVRGDPDCALESSILRSAFGDVELGIEFQIRALERGFREARSGRDTR